MPPRSATAAAVIETEDKDGVVGVAEMGGDEVGDKATWLSASGTGRPRVEPSPTRGLEGVVASLRQLEDAVALDPADEDDKTREEPSLTGCVEAERLAEERGRCHNSESL